VPCVRLEHLTETQKRAYIIADNKLALNAGWDEAMLALEFEELRGEDFDLSLTGFDAGDLAALMGEYNEGECDDEQPDNGSLADRFMVPPFSVLNAREGWWQNRKRAWLALGIRSELGRDAAPAGSKIVAGYDANGERKTGLVTESDTSIFDPVLCEIAYRWFSPVGGLVLDPFAGGSVRGIVAAKTGRSYVGVDLRQEQVDANRAQANEICADGIRPEWICADSRTLDALDVGAADMLFSCPPYADLEVYSDDPQDLSTLEYEDFRAAYGEIIAKACARLKPDRFACFVVGEVRDKRGNYYNFVGDTVEAFKAAGLSFYNEAILLTAVGSLPIRAGKQFSASRKLGKTHQNILVFVKGDGKRAAHRCGTVEIDESMFAAVDPAE